VLPGGGRAHCAVWRARQALRDHFPHGCFVREHAGGAGRREGGEQQWAVLRGTALQCGRHLHEAYFPLLQCAYAHYNVIGARLLLQMLVAIHWAGMTARLMATHGQACVHLCMRPQPACVSGICRGRRVCLLPASGCVPADIRRMHCGELGGLCGSSRGPCLWLVGCG